MIYKGPSDHLSRFFSLIELYQASQLLQADLLMDWQYLPDDEMVKGFFWHEDKMLKTHLCWPLNEKPEVNFCECQDDPYKSNDSHKNNDSHTSNNHHKDNCIHLAALAIETKVQIDRLPPPIKAVEAFDTEWDYLNQWISKQKHDPFPRMARHRIVYILNEENGCYALCVHKGYLSQHNEYQIKSPLSLSINLEKKLPKFFCQTDVIIFKKIQAMINADPQLQQNENTLQINHQINVELLQKMVELERCFWRSCYRKPLTWKNCNAANLSWKKVTAQLYFSAADNQLVYLNENINIEGVFDKLFEADLFDEQNLIAKLVISSEQLILPELNSQVEFELVAITFQYTDQYTEHEFQLQSLLHWIDLQDEKTRERIIHHGLTRQIILHLNQIEQLPSIKSHFEQSVSQNYDLSWRNLNGDLAHWLPLIRGLQLEGWKVNYADNFKLNQIKVDDWYSKISADNENKQWFELEVGVKVDGESINIMPYIVGALKQGGLTNKQNDISIKLPNEKVILVSYKRIDMMLKTLLELYDNDPLSKNNKLKLPLSHVSRVARLEKNLGHESQWEQAKALKQKAQRLSQNAAITEISPPKNLNAKLRDYQQMGLNWLQFLSRENLSGILADDMGLGKTLQTLAHIQVEKNNHKLKLPCLIVTPRSLLSNWQTEAAKFTPNLKVLSWRGSQRQQLLKYIDHVDIITISYGVLLRDANIMGAQKFHLVVLDEAHMIKNSRNKITQVAFKINAENRLCLTGTPLENHLGELWSLFHFLMPSFLGTEKQFKKIFRDPIEKENDDQRSQELAQRIAPFMLRRTKNKVAADLPKKTVMEILLALSESQADLYESVRMSMLKEVQLALAISQKNKNQLLIGNALLRLRQICCHPKLVKFEHLNTQNLESVKLNWLQNKLPKMIESGSRILIFSSFTSMLDIIAEMLNLMAINYLCLTGKTRRRSELIEKFQQGEAPVFLISLKAGGVGLNLTKADTVIHFDPWWNPAAENQASDRAHRIGQNKPVFIYKLISQGTIEERIHQMQKNKSQLAEQLYSNNNLQSKFKVDDWKALLAPLDEQLKVAPK